ncbi:hypothetical protein LTR84_012491 [Exophiala bonariae]|uniref:EF-hand domain-containing protein n=1 Tax=Exophiala bonariae TaxID=1690606 RepID=A0AAV9NGR5_9EURO|nr:hypothetical protein LTR84_012491 [Exophiala bonariae]
MAYNRAFNPDALPAHAEPEQAAQALSQLQGNRRQTSPNAPPGQRYGHQPRPGSPGSAGRRPSPAGRGIGPPAQSQPPPPSQSQNSYRPPPVQTYQQQRPHNAGQGYADNQYNRLQSPPPNAANYGFDRRGSNEQQSYPPRNTAPTDPDSVDLFRLFRAANASGTGSLTTAELGSALVNADFTPFDSRTIISLMRMFTSSPPNQAQGPTITFEEFENLWQFLAAWRTLFERFDEDGSGRISLLEFSKAMTAFGYRLSQQFVGVLYNTFNDRSPVQGQGMSFDLFVQACISLKRMTDVFKKYDDDRDGYVTLSFEEFLMEILRLRD